MEVAVFIKQMDDFNGSAALYRLSKPMAYTESYEDDAPEIKTEYVVVSAANVMFSGPETYIFPANEKGEVLNWGELGGSYRGGLSHEKALSGAGFAIQAEAA